MWYLPELFDLDPLYAVYTVALVIAGLVMIAGGSLNSGKGPWARLGTVALGLLFLGYGCYLYFFLPATFYIVWYIFVLPLLISVNVVRALVQKYERDEEPPVWQTSQLADPKA
ncbi:hypothetical protein L1785_04845 [Antribacter sp. KLBMP9083]|uniref:Uncharacterized protein n=1 Tax=Antribacter soli TaxID=2910976 RepID=A0AA41U8A9_9MICO|nr:hypothetical protein [Antribacter soli]MCF4120302.1 hypothetical protein [Antribacter soli]